MKKKVLALLSTLALFSCVGSTTSNHPSDYAGSVCITGEYGATTINIYKYQFDGHMYQYHHHPGGQCSFGGPVHDPDCPCHNKDPY